MTSRRHFLSSALVPVLATMARPSVLSFAGLDFGSLQRKLAALYDVDRSLVNLDAAYYGAMSKPVRTAYLERLDWLNRHNSAFLRNALPGARREDELGKSRAAVARLIGASPEEVALCSSGTDSLYALIANYGGLQPGDALLHCDADYDEMQHAMAYLATSRGAKEVRFSLPEPHTRANVLAAYERALTETPRAKLLLLTHVSNRNGLIPPVREIISLARARGVDVILDSAQAVGQLPVDVTALGADFVGFSLHKWVGAPLGTGGIYIRKERLADIQPWFGNRIFPAEDIRARLPTGTVDFAAHLTLPVALSVLDTLGLERKLAHLRALRDHWVHRARDIPGVELMLPPEQEDYGAISAFRLAGMRTLAQARQAQALFVEKHKVLVVAKAGLASGPVLRVTPALFTSTAELDRLVAAIQQERDLFA